MSDFPHVTEGIAELADLPGFFGGDGAYLRGTSMHCLLENCVGVVNDEDDPDGSSPD